MINLLCPAPDNSQITRNNHRHLSSSPSPRLASDGHHKCNTDTVLMQPPTSETADTWRASSVSLNRMSSMSGHQPLMIPGDPMPGHQRLMTQDSGWRTGGPPSHRRLSSFSSPSSLPASAPASPSMSRYPTAKIIRTDSFVTLGS